MNKQHLLFMIALTFMLVLSSCGSAQNSSTTANKDASVHDIEEESNELSTGTMEDETKGEAPADESDKAENVEGEAESVAKRNAEMENAYPFYPWEEQLPEGIEATVQKFDGFTLLIRYKNNTGKDIALSTEGSFFDENGDGINAYYTIQEYIKDGDDYVAILECDDYFEYYLLNSEIEKVGAKIQIANENLTVNSSANDDGSIHIEMSSSSEEWVSVDGYVFFTDDENNIVAYEPIGGGFEGEMSDDTDIPGKDYSDYFVCVSAID